MLFDALYFAGGSWTTRSPPLLRVLPWGDMWWCGHGNIPRVTLQGDSRVPSPSLSPGKTSYGMFGMISLSHCICRACRREGREGIILCTYRAMFKAATTHPEIPLPDELQQQAQVGQGPATPQWGSPRHPGTRGCLWVQLSSCKTSTHEEGTQRHPQNFLPRRISMQDCDPTPSVPMYPRDDFRA